MIFKHVIIPEQRLISLQYAGELSLSDVCRSSEILWADPAYEPSHNLIVDLTDISARAHVKDVASLLEFYKRPETSTGRIAIILSEPISTALTYLFRAAGSSTFKIGIFSTWDAACGFLHINLEPDVFDSAEERT
ncbi:hypothetical protein JIN85_05760 [Luteolibacter pohnpeiensis]|uniref:Uncharacterized protein n=1 Tax=Luteolibacter pohnpeiensis TaxID=454153 RepID=A0A934S605_9BACT|nr:hypothetical protein [Luteolibacter pohnpeiensis]MBK1881910.1 hypothetical protein [Luteolibacter pohnpeiensis]